MAAWDYTALTDTGRTVRGVTEADSQRQARMRIRESGLVPLEVDARHGESAGGGRRGRTGRMRGESLVLFTQTFATLLRAGLPVDDALQAIIGQTGDDAVAAVLIDVRARIAQGQTIDRALAAFPDSFDDVYRATVGAGEQTGHLPIVLARLGDHVQRSAALRQQIRLALVYPAVLTVISLLVVIGLMVYVVPGVVSVFEHEGERLPLLTRGLIASSDLIRDYGLAALLAGAAGLVAARRVSRMPGPRLAAARLLLRLPVLGAVIVRTDFARFARTLGVLLGNGVEMTDALMIAAKSCSSPVVRAALTDTTHRVREGESLNGALRRTALAPRLLCQLAASGECSGALPALLEAAAETLERETAAQQAVLLQLVEPALIVAMGGVVLVVVLAILLPIFDMNTLI